MNDITFSEGRGNLGSLSKIEFIPIEDVIEIPAVKNLILTTDLILQPGARWYMMQCTFETMGMGYDSEKTIHGDKYNPKISAFIPKLTPDIEATLQEMQGHLFLVRATDNNGYVRIIGTIDAPLQFSNDGSAGKIIADKNGTNISFAGEAVQKPYYYIPS
jgi:hypothetical protein